MATAAINLKDHVTCPVCLDLFNEPKILKCLHTICDSCMTNLQRFNIIVCPVCREKSPINQIKSDFKTQALLDLYIDPDQSQSSTRPRKSRETTSTDPNRIIRLCGVCKQGEIISYCCQCKVLICQSCRMSHNRIPSCKDHTFGLDTYRKDQAQHLLQAVSRLELMGIGSPNEQLRFDGIVHDLETEAIKEIRLAEQQVLAEVKKHHQSLIGLVQLKKFKILSVRAKQKEELKHWSLGLHGRVATYTKELVQPEDDREVTLETIAQDSQKVAEFEDEIERLKRKYSADSCACRTVIQVRKEDYNQHTGTKVIFKETKNKCLIQ